MAHEREVENDQRLERANEGSANKEHVRRCAPDCNNSQPLKRAGIPMVYWSMVSKDT